MSKHNIQFSPEAFADYKYWQTHDLKTLKKINELIKSIERDRVTEGVGKPEILKGNLSGYYSRRINREQRLVYTVSGNKLLVASCRYHY